MTEKRYIDVGNGIIDLMDYTGEPISSYDLIVDRLNEQDEELQNLKNQIKIYELFLDQNDLNIEWDLFCTLNYCVNDEDTGCQTCKYMGLMDGDVK